jgi:hypothetical protein
MTLHLLRRLVATLPIQPLQAFLIALALWLATATLLEPMLQWPLEERAKLGPAAWRLTVACLFMPPLTSLFANLRPHVSAIR